MANYIEQHIDLNKVMSLYNIECKFIDLDFNDAEEVLHQNCVAVNTWSFNERQITNRFDAYDFVKKNYKKLLLTCTVN